MTVADKLWQGWAQRQINLENPIPLFETNEDLIVESTSYGRNSRQVLKRSEQMEARVRREGRKVIEDWETTDDRYSGLIYVMYWLKEGEVVPLYIGKAGKYGNDGERLSANLEGLRRTSTGKFARWGDGHDYHIGDLSAIIFDHDKNQERKYERWADQLFDGGQQLTRQTYFWTTAWRHDDTGPYHATGVSVEKLERELIELTAGLVPSRLLNTDGT